MLLKTYFLSKFPQILANIAFSHFFGTVETGFDGPSTVAPCSISCKYKPNQMINSNWTEKEALSNLKLRINEMQTMTMWKQMKRQYENSWFQCKRKQKHNKTQNEIKQQDCDKYSAVEKFDYNYISV